VRKLASEEALAKPKCNRPPHLKRGGGFGVIGRKNRRIPEGLSDEREREKLVKSAEVGERGSFGEAKMQSARVKKRLIFPKL